MFTYSLSRHRECDLVRQPQEATMVQIMVKQLNGVYAEYATMDLGSHLFTHTLSTMVLMGWVEGDQFVLLAG